jgi:hypothetical protein
MNDNKIKQEINQRNELKIHFDYEGIHVNKM